MRYSGVLVLEYAFMYDFDIAPINKYRLRSKLDEWPLAAGGECMCALCEYMRVCK